MSVLLWLSVEQMARRGPFVFAKSHGRPRVEDRRVWTGIIFINCNNLSSRHAPAEYGPAKTDGCDGSNRRTPCVGVSL